MNSGKAKACFNIAHGKEYHCQGVTDSCIVNICVQLLLYLAKSNRSFESDWGDLIHDNVGWFSCCCSVITEAWILIFLLIPWSGSCAVNMEITVYVVLSYRHLLIENPA